MDRRRIVCGRDHALDGFRVWPDWLDWLLDGKKTFVSAVLNGVTLAGLYFLVASGLTLVFGLMRNVNLAHGSLYLLGAYIGYDAALWSDNWFVGVIAGALAIAVIGALLQVLVFQRLTGDELRQTLVTIGISIVAADLIWPFGAARPTSSRFRLGLTVRWRPR